MLFKMICHKLNDEIIRGHLEGAVASLLLTADEEILRQGFGRGRVEVGLGGGVSEMNNYSMARCARGSV
jgi:hypothetical protein